MSEVERPVPALRTLLSLAWPVIVSRSTQVVIGVSDAVMVASLGEAALAATTAGGLNTFALLILPMGVTFIVSSFSSQLFGKGDVAGARRYGHYGLLLAAMTQALCMAGIPLVPALLARFPYAPDVRTMMATYLQIRLLSGGAAIGSEALGNYYGGIPAVSQACAGAQPGSVRREIYFPENISADRTTVFGPFERSAQGT